MQFQIMKESNMQHNPGDNNQLWEETINCLQGDESNRGHNMVQNQNAFTELLISIWCLLYTISTWTSFDLHAPLQIKIQVAIHMTALFAGLYPIKNLYLLTYIDPTYITLCFLLLQCCFKLTITTHQRSTF